MHHPWYKIPPTKSQEKDESIQCTTWQQTKRTTKRMEHPTSGISLQIQVLSFQNQPCGFSYHGGNLIIMPQILVISPTSKIYTVSTVLFHKYGGANVAVTNFMSHFYMFVPTKATVKLANVNTGHVQGIGIILCHFPNCQIIYPVEPVYYFLGQPSNTISSGALNFYVGFKKFIS